MATTGRVVRIRLSPKDCLRVIDAFERFEGREIDGTSMSFSYVVKQALVACLHALERDRVIPAREGFEYNTVMDQFPIGTGADQYKGRQIAYTKQQQSEREVEWREDRLVRETLSAPTPTMSVPTINPAPKLDDYETGRLKRRLEELKFKMDQDPANMSVEEGIELTETMAKLQGIRLVQGKKTF